MKLLVILLLLGFTSYVSSKHFHSTLYGIKPHKSEITPTPTPIPKSLEGRHNSSTTTLHPHLEERLSAPIHELKLSGYEGQLQLTIFLNDQDGNFYLGIDLNFSHIWIADESCYDCIDANVDYLYNSNLPQDCLNTYNLKQLQYKQLTLQYIMCQDLFLIQDQILQTKFIFNITFHLTPLKGFSSGILGLGFNQDKNNSFLHYLKDQGSIDKKEFSFYFPDIDSDDANLIIGGKKESLAQGIWSYCYLEVNQGMLFQVDFISLVSKEGDQRETISINPKSNEYQLLGEKALIDINYDKIELYEDDFRQLIKILRETFLINCYESHYIHSIYSCDNNDFSQYPYLQIFMCDGICTFSPEQYLQCKDGCRIKIKYTKMKQIKLGKLFLKSYYLHFVEDHPRRIGFASLSN